MTRPAALLLALALPNTLPAAEWRLDARTAFATAVAQNVRLDPDGSLVLDSGVLVEDDGPAAGYTYAPNEEKLSASVRARKGLVVADPRAKGVTLLVGPGGDLKATVNGAAVELRDPKKVGGYWQAYSLPPGVLKTGGNTFEFHGAGKLWIARAEDFPAGGAAKHPGRSARSAEGGSTWVADRLGPAGDIRGEYYVRLWLDQFRPAGSLTLPVIDLGNPAGRAVAPPLASVGPVTVSLDADPGPAGRVTAKVRTGPTPVPNAAWSDWQPGGVREPHGRFAQVTVELTTTDPLRTPHFRGLRVEANPRPADDWAAKLTATDADNPEIVRSAVPFAYEPFAHPRLKELRDQFKLDDVAAGARTEFELIERLARWSAARWDRGHLKDGYPPWDSLDILKPHADGTPTGGFCQQYNLVFLQACECFGIPGRCVSIGPGDHGGAIRGGGHEVVEVWSNQHRKWVYVDGDMAWYAADAKTGVPLSLWELRDRQIPALAGKPFDPVKVVTLAPGRKTWAALTDWPPFLELRLIPRSDFLAKPAPLPLNQGMRGWFWTGHHAYTDDAHPASLLYSHRVPRRRDWEWALNQARYTLEATATPGEVRVHLETETPGFDTFLAALDGGPAKPATSGFVWKLHAGKNRLEVAPRNTAGRDGIAARVTLEGR